MTTQAPGKIYAAMTKTMGEVGFIGKNNQARDYKFRGIDDAYGALQLILAKHEVFTVSTILADRTEEKTSKNGNVIIYRILTIRYRFYCSDGSYVDTETVGEGMDTGDKASNKAMSVAHKYALLQAFCVPTKEPKDPEHDDHEIVATNNNTSVVNQKKETSPTNAERVLKMVDAFGMIGVDVDMIRTFLKKPAQDATDADIKNLQDVYVKIARGASITDFFR